jgi:hypothetical protein
VIFCERRTFPSRLYDCHVDKIDDNNLAKPFCYFASPEQHRFEGVQICGLFCQTFLLGSLNLNRKRPAI